MKESNPEDKPPVFGSWKRMYLFVLFNLAFMILLFYLLTIALR